jgi:MFS family permease
MGPSIGGLLYSLGHLIPYGVCASLVAIAAVASFLLPNPPPPAERPKVTWDTLVAGFRFIAGAQAVLGAMLFDLVVVLFGGVSALLPIFARDILDIGAWGAGVLRSAPALGALIAGATLARFPVRRHGGLFMFAGLAAYGMGTIVFGLSRDVALSIAALMVIGSGDMVSSVIRQTLIQINTPDAMRGRVFAVNSLFIGTSGQLGGFYAGVSAALFGAVTAAVIGGCAVFATVALWTWLFPALRRVDRPDVPQPAGSG